MPSNLWQIITRIKLHDMCNSYSICLYTICLNKTIFEISLTIDIYEYSVIYKYLQIQVRDLHLLEISIISLNDKNFVL